MSIQPALKADADKLAYLINLAGEGIPRFLWSQMAEPGQDAMTLGAFRAAREEGGFSYTNARVVKEEGELQAMMIAYKQPDPFLLDDIDDYPDIVRPLVELEAQLPGSWYINAIATFEQYRGQGLAQALLEEAEDNARAAACKIISLIVASENRPALSLYEYLGYRFVAAKPVISYPGCLHGGDWLLMAKAL